METPLLESWAWMLWPPLPSAWSAEKHRKDVNKGLCTGTTVLCLLKQTLNMSFPVNDPRLILACHLTVTKSKLQLTAAVGVSTVGKMNIFQSNSRELNHFRDPPSQSQKNRFKMGTSSAHFAVLGSSLRRFSGGVVRKDSTWDGFQMLTFLLKPVLGTSIPLLIMSALGMVANVSSGLYLFGACFDAAVLLSRNLWENWWKCPHFRSTPAP